MLTSNSERQALAKRDADIEALRATTTKAELALVQAENDLLRQRIRALETALARRRNAAKSVQTKAIRVIARLKEKDKERRQGAMGPRLHYRLARKPAHAPRMPKFPDNPTWLIASYRSALSF
jgi:hypothetical protein